MAAKRWTTNRNTEAAEAAPEFSAPFEAASPPPPPKLPEVTIPVSVDVVLGVDAMLRNAIFQMGLGDNEGVRRNVQGAIRKLYPAFEETGKALTGKMEENPPGLDVSAKLLVVAKTKAGLIKQLEWYVDRLKAGLATEVNHATDLGHLRVHYSEDREKPKAWMLTPRRRREIDAYNSAEPEGSNVCWHPDPGTGR